MTLRSSIAVAVMLAAGGCRGAQIDIHNQSSGVLRDVVVSANGASTTIGRIGAGDTRRRFLCPRGEAGTLDVSFEANGQRHRQRQPVYFECDVLYRLQVDVSSAYDVSVNASLR